MSAFRLNMIEYDEAMVVVLVIVVVDPSFKVKMLS
jgi:hypothetical protein